jgi:hypothetical protein
MEVLTGAGFPVLCFCGASEGQGVSLAGSEDSFFEFTSMEGVQAVWPEWADDE